MTVCVAAMCAGPMIIGASDRMLTASDVQFEPQQTKIVSLTNSIAIMVAGDSALQLEILQIVQADVNKRIQDEPEKWWNIRDVADLYNRYYNQAHLRRAENAILAPLGLDQNTFLSRQQQMSPQLVQQLATELINFQSPKVAAIFTGNDPTGAHIYVANDGDVTCQDGVGFTAIGAGYWHANSQFMFAGHTKWKPLPETLLLTYAAKKRAEVAPGVGEATDMFMIGPALGSYTSIGEHVLGKLEEIYQRMRKKEQKIIKIGQESVNQYVNEIAKAATIKEQAAIPEDSGGNEATDQKELRNEVDKGSSKT